MELITLEITPKSAFLTPPKGDTLFGQILSYLFFKGDNSFANYLQENPKLVVSDMMPKGYVYRPNLPLDCFKSLSEVEVDKKKIRSAKYIKLQDLQNGDLHKCKKIDFMQTTVVVKNSVNRQTSMTGGEDFAPYSIVEYTFSKTLWLFMLVESTLKEKVLDILAQIGEYGFGKKSSIGKGLFCLSVIETPVKMNIDTPYHMGISPVILHKQDFDDCWYEPYTKFGKYGLQNGLSNAFKRPIIMAQSGCVVKKALQNGFFGSAVDVGSANKPSYNQGYSIAIPFMLKDEKCLDVK